MTTQEEFLARLSVHLKDSGIPFMVSGSVVSSVYGEPRLTNDIDIVIDPTAESLDRFVKSIPDDWYVSDVAAMQAMRDRTMFNIIDADSAWKADLIVRKQRAFSEMEFSRRKVTNVLGSHLPVVTLEDSILSKLEWSRESESQQQFKDARSMAMVNRDDLDRAYLKQWAGQLGLVALLDQLLTELDRTKK